jgi:hypothetical protein
MAANKEDFLARMDAIHEKKMAMLDDHQKRMMGEESRNDAVRRGASGCTQ